MDWSASGWFWPTIGGAILSGLTGWVFAWWGSKQVAKTHQQLVILLRALEAEGAIQLNRDHAGDATGIIIKLSGAAIGSSRVSGDLTVTERAETSHVDRPDIQG